ncbi:hypothetical protein [Bernardetia sp. MNP-M8]|uniref:hypothetical protein n=1 Tax=Bernardetia sp. MNP-M8 TaxID=3127470 RepID=UPI0030D621BF
MYKLRADGSLTDKEIESVGNRNEPNLELALLVTSQFKEANILWINSASEDNGNNEKIEATYYTGTGGDSKWCLNCFCTKYPAKKLSSNFGSLNCNEVPISNSIYWKRCSDIDCNNTCN